MCIWHLSPFISIQLLWINLVTDSLPAIALGMEKLDPDVMSHKPRAKEESLFAHKYGLQIILQGVMFAALSLASYCIGMYGLGFTDPAVAACAGSTLSFFTLVFSKLLHAYNMRSGHSLFKIGPFSNRALNLVTCITAALAAFVLFTPYVVNVFGMMYLPWQGYLAGVGLSFVPSVVMEIVKAFGQPF